MKSEHQLLLDWRSGDRDAGSQLLTRYIPLLRRFFDARIPEHAEDLIQQTLMAFLREGVRGPSTSSCRAYLLAIARNRLADHHRAVGRRIATDPVSCSGAVDPSTTPSQRVGRQELGSIVQGCLRQMSDVLRLALELHYWEGFSMSEVADVLNVPIGTAKSRVRLAREQFSRYLDAAWDPKS